jgi:hypothetical protein
MIWAPVFEFRGLYPDPNGPDRETVLLGRELCIGQEAIKYPDPNVTPITPRLKAVGDFEPLEAPDFGPPAPPPSGPDDYGARDDDNIPF